MVSAKGKGDKQARKTDAERRKTTWNLRPKITVTLRCRAENAQLGKGYSCGTAVAGRRMATKEIWWAAQVGMMDHSEEAGRISIYSVSNYPTRSKNKLMHPQSNAESPDQAQRPKIQINPIDSWSSQPSNSCTTWPHQINQKKVTTPERHVLKPEPCHAAMRSWSVSRSKLEKEVSTADKRKWGPVLRPVVQTATNDRAKSERRRSPVLRPVVQPTTNDRVKSEKRPAISLYLDELLN